MQSGVQVTSVRLPLSEFPVVLGYYYQFPAGMFLASGYGSGGWPFSEMASAIEEASLHNVHALCSPPPSLGSHTASCPLGSLPFGRLWRGWGWCGGGWNRLGRLGASVMAAVPTLPACPLHHVHVVGLPEVCLRANQGWQVDKDTSVFVWVKVSRYKATFFWSFKNTGFRQITNYFSSSYLRKEKQQS